MKQAKWYKMGAIVVTLSLLVSGVLSYAAAAEKEKVIIWKSVDYFPLVRFQTRLQKDFFKNIEERTGGRLKFEYYPAQQLIKAKEFWEQTSKGTVEMFHAPFTYYVNHSRPLEVLDLPFLFTSEGMRNALEGELTEKFAEILERYNLVPITYLFNIKSSTLISTKGPLVKPSDFKGLKIRAGAQSWSKICTTLGATSVRMPSSEVFLALQTGTIEASWSSLDGSYEQKQHTIAKHWTILNACWTPTWLIANKDAWEDLPEDIKKIVIEEAKKLKRNAIKIGDKNDAGIVAKLKEAECKVYTPLPQQMEVFVRLSKELLEEWKQKAGKDGEELIKIIKKYNP